MTLTLSGPLLVLGNHAAIADEHGDGPTAYPVELYACNYLEGKGPADLDKATAEFNAWADKQKLTDYSAYTLTPFYMGPEQDFDYVWLGTSPSAEAMGRAQDNWLATGQKGAAAFAAMSSCDAHGNFAALPFKAPPDEQRSSFVLSFSDCSMPDGVTFGDVAPALGEWAEYRTSHGSEAGMWVLFPAYGGGGEEFDFKFVAGNASLAEQGKDWDQYAKEGWKKAEELFTGKLECDSARVYVGTTRRRAADGD